MLRRAHAMMGTKLHALDGDIGRVDDLYFDDLKWVVRYMIVRTGSWLSEKYVMLSPSSIRDLVWDAEAVYVDLTQQQIKDSPDLDAQKPVTREQEMELVRHYRWPSYWSDGAAGTTGAAGTNLGIGVTGIPALGVMPIGTDRPLGGGAVRPDHIANDISSTGVADSSVQGDIADSPEVKTEAELQRAANAKGLHHHLRGVKAVTGYHIAAGDGEIGHVEDFFVDEEGWQIQYLLVDTGSWLPGRKVLISTEWISHIVWEDSQVHVKATREQVKSSPEYDPSAAVDHRYEERLHDHYGYRPRAR